MVSIYLVYFKIDEFDSSIEYVKASSAQEAVNFIRDFYEPFEIIEVSKVVKNWR